MKFNNSKLGLKVASGLILCCALAIPTYISITQSTMSASDIPSLQGQQTVSASEQEKNNACIDEVLFREIKPIHPVARISKEQHQAFFSAYPAQCSNVPEHIKKSCVQFVAQLHPDVLKIALLAAENMGIDEPIFFYETASVCHALTANGFNRLGLNLSVMLAFHPDYHDKLKPAVKERHIDYFLRHLYHELHHIKNKDDSCKISGITHAESNVLCRHNEMRAELGGLWGAHHFHDRDINMKAFYPEDDGMHPTAQDQLRYNSLLAEALKAATDTNGAELVGQIAQNYLEEKSPVLFEKQLKLHTVQA